MPTCHYYATTAFGWVTADDLWKTLNDLKKTGGYNEGTAKKGTTYTVFRVPGTNADTNYEIVNYTPQVKDAELIASGKF